MYYLVIEQQPAALTCYFTKSAKRYRFPSAFWTLILKFTFFGDAEKMAFIFDSEALMRILQSPNSLTL
jgi:hypothetical protein